LAADFDGFGFIHGRSGEKGERREYLCPFGL